MPWDPASEAAARRLIGEFEQARANLLSRYEALLASPTRRVEAARLRELIAVHGATITELRASTRAWLTDRVPELHAAGARRAAAMVGSSITWTQDHRAAVQEMATRSWDDIAARLQDVDSTTRRVLRRELADATRATLLESRTAVQAGRDVARAAREAGLWTVTYADGSLHSIADWADSAVRQVTAETYNRGSVTQCRTDGIEHVEYADGPGCCVGPGHRNGPEANGLIVALDDVVWTSHPRCRRACLPAPEGQPLTGSDRDPGPGLDPEPATASPVTKRDRIAQRRATPRAPNGTAAS